MPQVNLETELMSLPPEVQLCILPAPSDHASCSQVQAAQFKTGGSHSAPTGALTTPN